MRKEDHHLAMHWMTLEEVYAKTISYAQNYEDILLARVLPEPDGFYIDIGANHPVFHSVTKLFSERGWRGINAEPSQVVFQLLAEDRPRDINLNVGLGSSVGMMTFFEATERHGWSTFRPELSEHYRGQGVEIAELSVPVTTLAKVCEEHVDRTIDFLKIDAEGFEREILLGADFSRWRPRILVIENAWPETWEPLIDGFDYLPATFDGLNRFYVRSEDRDLLPAFASTANVLDNFVPYEYVRLFREASERRGSTMPNVIQSIQKDARRVARKIHRAVRGLSSRAG
jgi:FkbM family methyltransferase